MQKEIDEWIKAEGNGYWSPLSMLARLTEETGKVARVLEPCLWRKKEKRE